MDNKHKLSGPERGEVNVAKFETYLTSLVASGRSLPMEGDRANITLISAESGVLRNAFYTNSRIKKLLKQHLGEDEEASGRDEPAGRYEEKIERLERDKLQLEQRLAAAKAENEELRQRLSEAEQELGRYVVIEEEVLTAGRRIIP